MSAVLDRKKSALTAQRGASLLRADEGQLVVVADDMARVLLTGPDTMGQLSAAEVTAFPGLGPLPHSHPVLEVFYVLEGKVEFLGMHDGRWSSFIGGPGASFTVPADTPHCFRGAGDVPARVLVLFSPSTMDAFFASVARPVTEGNWKQILAQPPDLERMQAAGEPVGLKLIDPALPFDGESVHYDAGNPAAALPVMADRLRFIARGSRDGYISVAELAIPAGSGVPLHSHRAAEMFYIVEGELAIMAEIDGRLTRFLAKVGDIVNLPAEVPHAYMNNGAAAMKTIVTIYGDPANSMEHFFGEVGCNPQLALEGEPTAEQIRLLMETCERYGIRMLADKQPALTLLS
jgi:quercetin dioxygenase-like cupin family protein